MGRFNQIFGMRHHTEHVAGFVGNACDIVDGTIRIGSLCIAKHNLSIVFDLFQRMCISKIISIVMSNGAAQDLTLVVAVGENRFRIGNAKFHFFGNKSQTCIAHQGTRQQASLGQDLKSVANP